MINRLFIDGNDAYLQYGAYVVSGGWNELVAYPPLKSVESNDWQEEDGVEADLSEPVLNTREVSVKFAFGGLFSRFCLFIELLSDGAYHDFDCAYIGRKYRLRMTQQPNLDIAKALGTATIKFADDFPMQGYEYRVPSSGMPVCDDYLIDNAPTTNYGLRVLQGTMSEIMRPAAVKQNLLRNIKTLSGAIYDGKAVTFKAKDVKLKCLMRAETLDGLWRNYDALLYDLIQPEERLLTVRELEQDFPCYYKSCQVSDFYPDGRIWLAFTLTLTFTGSFRLDDTDFVLATEDGVIVFTQDGENAIEMLPDKYSARSMQLVNDRHTIRLTGNGNIRFND